MALDPDYSDVPRDDEGNPVLFILPTGLREQYEERMTACEEGWRATEDPRFVSNAVAWVRIYRQTIPAWLDEAVRVLAEGRRTLRHGACQGSACPRTKI